MSTWVCLLRGVNVGGKHRLAMKDLAELFESLGYADVRTVIQSGNVVFSSEGRVPTDRIEEQIRARFGFSVSVVVRSATELAKVLSANPFGKAETAKLHVGFLPKEPTPTLVRAIDSEAFAPERFVVRGTEIYLYLPNGMARTKLPSHLERRLGIGATVRNWNTLTKLVELAGSR